MISGAIFFSPLTNQILELIVFSPEDLMFYDGDYFCEVEYFTDKFMNSLAYIGEL